MLRALMASHTKEFIQMLMLRRVPDCIVTPRGTKAILIDAVIACVKRGVPDMYPLTLSHFKKDAIDSTLPRKGKTKRQSIEMLLLNRSLWHHLSQQAASLALSGPRARGHVPPYNMLRYDTAQRDSSAVAACHSSESRSGS